mgnify:CR=1 FL=1
MIPASTWIHTVKLGTLRRMSPVATAMITASTMPPMIVPCTVFRGFIVFVSEIFCRFGSGVCARRRKGYYK